MKNLIVYYSYEGNTEALVKGMKEVIDADVICLEPVKEKKSSGMFRFVWGAQQVYMTKQPELKPYNKDFAQYENIILAGPCWFGTYCPPLKTFLAENKFSGKNFYLFTCNGNNLRNTHKDYMKALEGNTIVSTLDLVYPIKNDIGKAKDEANNWIKENLK